MLSVAIQKCMWYFFFLFFSCRFFSHELRLHYVCTAQTLCSYKKKLPIHFWVHKQLRLKMEFYMQKCTHSVILPLDTVYFSVWAVYLFLLHFFLQNIWKSSSVDIATRWFRFVLFFLFYSFVFISFQFKAILIIISFIRIPM